MNLVIDIGNSLTKIAIFDKNNLIKHFVLPELNIDRLNKIKSDFPDIKNCIISTVVTSAQKIIKFLKSKFLITIVLNFETPIPIENKYVTKEALGNDRIATVVGANFKFPETNLLVIDAGTAITLDFINKTCEYIGGNISPGLSMRYRALHNYTSKLPLLSFEENNGLIGNTTRSAIINGVQYGIIYEIDGYISEFKKEYNDLKVIITGGDAHLFDNKLKNTIFVVANLTLIGLNRILEYNTNNER